MRMLTSFVAADFPERNDPSRESGGLGWENPDTATSKIVPQKMLVRVDVGISFGSKPSTQVRAQTKSVKPM